MKISLVKPLKKPAKFRMTYNGKEFFVSREFAAGETPEVEAAQPRVPGEGLMFMIVGDKEIPMGSARYSKVNVADLLIEDAAELSAQKHLGKAARLLRRAISIMEKEAPDYDRLATAYHDYCFARWFMRGRKSTQETRRRDAVSFYEKGLAVHEKSGKEENLGPELTNISVLYARLGDHETALARAVRGYEIERKRTELQDESLSAWTHAAACYVECGKLDEAEAVIKDGVERFGSDYAYIGYLYAIQANVFEARAKHWRKKADENVPPEHCPL